MKIALLPHDVTTTGGAGNVSSITEYSNRRRSTRSRSSCAVKKYSVIVSSTDTLALVKLKIFQEVPEAVPIRQVLFVNEMQLTGQQNTLLHLGYVLYCPWDWLWYLQCPCWWSYHIAVDRSWWIWRRRSEETLLLTDLKKRASVKGQEELGHRYYPQSLIGPLCIIFDLEKVLANWEHLCPGGKLWSPPTRTISPTMTASHASLGKRGESRHGFFCI